VQSHAAEYNYKLKIVHSFEWVAFLFNSFIFFHRLSSCGKLRVVMPKKIAHKSGKYTCVHRRQLHTADASSDEHYNYKHKCARFFCRSLSSFSLPLKYYTIHIVFSNNLSSLSLSSSYLYNRNTRKILSLMELRTCLFTHLSLEKRPIADIKIM
jgi:hypothetical protein